MLIDKPEMAQTEDRGLSHDVVQCVLSRTDELEAANVDLAAFEQSVAHDLRNPVAAIRAFAELLEGRCGQKLDVGDLQLIGKILHATRRMDNIVGNLLRLSQCKPAELTRRNLDLSDCVQRILRKFQQGEPNRKATVTVEPNLRVNADPGLLQFALENLLSNAWKYTAYKEHATISFGRFRDVDEFVYFVRDNGAGFSMAHADELFQPFHRLHSITEFPGCGIGLTIAKRVITRHGGRIWGESKPSQGAAFHFTLPNV
jgi:light-regulated signal transduction histidine kinase (bacteriophytochrome)